MCPVNECWIKHARSMAHLFVLHLCYAVKTSLSCLFHCPVTLSNTFCSLAVWKLKRSWKKNIQLLWNAKIRLKAFSNPPNTCLPHTLYLHRKGSNSYFFIEFDDFFVVVVVWCLRSLFPRTENTSNKNFKWKKATESKQQKQENKKKTTQIPS